MSSNCLDERDRETRFRVAIEMAEVGINYYCVSIYLLGTPFEEPCSHAAIGCCAMSWYLFKVRFCIHAVLQFGLQAVAYYRIPKLFR